ncbi:hypothetical protein [Hymenobacter swuensis]|uniref:Lipoprotein n=1 Tax=Hymenobacter swuensis DY53 TaxID=1227739 RepID=W8F8P8_9BACT|nr:hypothetical protein [Hymenobacter swuensis]AHJ98090.1 hypothetical protein Hsw_2495 [Hymenobacter swuensis DY53]
MRTLRWMSLCMAVFLAVACQPEKPAEQATAPPVPPNTVQAAAVPVLPSVPPDTVDWLARTLPGNASTDTMLQIEGKSYRLRLSASADSTRMLRVSTGGIVGEAFAVDSNFVRNKLVQGPSGSYVIQLLAAGQPVMRRRFQKPDFYTVAERAIVVVSEPTPPRFLGYYPELGGLAFWQQIGIPASEVGSYFFYLLDLKGKVRELSFGNQFGEGHTDCDPLPAPGGKALLTCARLLRPGQPPLNLQKPQADLALARFLSDTTLLVLYNYGEYKTETDNSGLEEMSWQVPPHLRNKPNGFVLNLQGKQLARFRFNSLGEEMGYYVRRAYVPAVQTYYLLDAERGVRLLAKQNPAATREVPFRQMTPFSPPQRPMEVQFTIRAGTADFVFYADKAHPEKLRYQRSRNAE